MPPLRRLFLPLLLALLGGLVACNREAPPTEKIRTVMVHTITSAPSSGTVFTGEIRARHELDLAFRVGGKIAVRLVDTGSEIRAGQVLARLDPADLQLASNAAAAQLAAAVSEEATSRAERERYAGLLARKFVSQAAFDAREHAWQSARARVEQARAQQQISSNQTSYGSLSTDFPALVSAVLADAGQVVAAGQPVLRVARSGEMEVAIAVPESRLEEIRQARNFAVHLWIAPQTVLRGELRELGAVADAATRTYPARIRLLDTPANARLGMTARVLLTTADAPAHLRVPLAAVGNHGQGAFVWLVRDGKLEQRPVTIAGYSERDVLIASGLASGDQVVSAGLSRLQAGQAVQAKEAPPPAEQR